MLNLKVGDPVIRVMPGNIRMPLTVTAVTPSRIICGSWEFDKLTGIEIDEDIGCGPLTFATSVIFPHESQSQNPAT